MSNTKKIVNHNYTRRSEPEGGFKTLEEFYPFYLGEHCNRANRRLHIIGTTIFYLLNVLAIRHRNLGYFLLSILQGYILAWFGHFFLEKNTPATFRYPIWSFKCDQKMYLEVITGKRAF